MEKNIRESSDISGFQEFQIFSVNFGEIWAESSRLGQAQPSEVEKNNDRKIPVSIGSFRKNSKKNFSKKWPEICSLQGVTEFLYVRDSDVTKSSDPKNG